MGPQWNKTKLQILSVKVFILVIRKKNDTFYHCLIHGVHTRQVARFPDIFDKKMPTFKSKYWCPNISQVIALRFIWENEDNYLVSTTHLVSRVIKHLTKSKSHGTLIVPHWPSAAFWLFLRNRFTNTFQDFVTDFIKKATLPQVFSCEFCKIYKNTFSYRAPPVTDSEYVTNYTERVTIHKLRGF